VLIRIDESGDFDFRDASRFRVATIACVIAPELRRAAIDSFVAEKRREWEMDAELKAGRMNGDQLMEMAAFLERERLPVVAVVTDSEIFNIAAQRQWREEQVELFEAAADRSTRAIEDPPTRSRVQRIRTRLPSERHVSPPNFLQYFVLMPWLLSRAFSAANFRFRALDPRDDSWTYDIAVDPRVGADPGKTGQLLRDSVDAIYAGNTGTALFVPPEWPADHPFLARNADPETETISSRQLLAGGIRTPDSQTDAGLQLADFVAHAIHSVVRDRDEHSLALWRRLRPLMVPTDDGQPLMAWAWGDEEPGDEAEERYRRLLL
jgi:hypothetical protein